MDDAIRRLKQLEQDCRAECKPIIDEMVRVESTYLRPITICGGQIEYGLYPPEVEAYLAELREMMEFIRGSYAARIHETLGSRTAASVTAAQ